MHEHIARGFISCACRRDKFHNWFSPEGCKRGKTSFPIVLGYEATTNINRKALGLALSWFHGATDPGTSLAAHLS